MSEFASKLNLARKDKNSLLCIGLDPAPAQNNMLEYCRGIVEDTSDYAAAYKPNSQFVLFNLKVGELKKLTKEIREAGCVSILDHKLSDIGSSNESAIYHIKECGFDALTASPFPGNIKETTDLSHKNKLGVFFLTLMSNPEAEWIQKQTLWEGLPLYQKIADEIRTNKADGLVVGTTGHIKGEDIAGAREHAGKDAVFLCPGIGAQGGDIKKIISYAGENILINVGRTIINDKDPEKKAREYNELINKNRRK
jgi:orotidine 5'-phosphate decarboxylase subfamily 2